MAEERTWWETVKGEGGELIERVKALVHEGNIRRIVVRQGDRSIAEFPLTVGVVGTVGAPVLAALGAIVALATNCSIAVQREAAAAPAPADPPGPPADAPPSEPPDEASPSEVAAEPPVSEAPSEPPADTEPPPAT